MADLLIILGIILFGIIILILSIIFIPWKFGAPYDPSRKKEIDSMIELAEIKEGDKAVDLGSGDGRLVIELAKAGAEAHGYEVNPFLVWLSKSKIRKQGLENKAFIHKKNFWESDLGNFDIITIFQISFVMNKLGEKIKKSGKKGVKVISNTWKFPQEKPTKSKSNVYLYIFNKKELSKN